MFKTLKAIRAESKQSYQTADKALKASKKQQVRTDEITTPISENSKELTRILGENHFAETLIRTIRNMPPQ